MLLDEFRSAKIGRITLELPPESEKVTDSEKIEPADDAIIESADSAKSEPADDATAPPDAPVEE